VTSTLEPDDYDPDADAWGNPAGLPQAHGWVPFTDAASRTILEAAVLCLATLRGGCHDDAGATVSVLVSLLAEGECWLPDLVADARDQCYSWDAIAQRLATTISTARHRYAAYATWRRQHSATPSRSR
jgi:hypothetical protein